MLHDDETPDAKRQKIAEQKYSELKKAIETAGFFVARIVGDKDGDRIDCTSKYEEGCGYTGRIAFVTEANGRWFLATPHPYHYQLIDPTKIEESIIGFLSGKGVPEGQAVRISSEEYERSLMD